MTNKPSTTLLKKLIKKYSKRKLVFASMESKAPTQLKVESESFWSQLFELMY